jgi:hypothetical protein
LVEKELIHDYSNAFSVYGYLFNRIPHISPIRQNLLNSGRRGEERADTLMLITVFFGLGVGLVFGYILQRGRF